MSWARWSSALSSLLASVRCRRGCGGCRESGRDGGFDQVHVDGLCDVIAESQTPVVSLWVARVALVPPPGLGVAPPIPADHDVVIGRAESGPVRPLRLCSSKTAAGRGTAVGSSIDGDLGNVHLNAARPRPGDDRGA